jgi:hypothetical protein
VPKIYFTVNGSEDIDVLPNGLAVFSSVSNRGYKCGDASPPLFMVNYAKYQHTNVIPTTTSSNFYMYQC